MPDDKIFTGFRHSDTGQWSAEASDLGLAPGQWPLTITANCDGKTYVGRTPTIHRNADGDITHLTYYATGARLVIWND